MLKVGIIGAGFMGREHARCYSIIKKTTLYGVFDIENKKAINLASKYKIKNVYKDIDKLINEVDIVDICLPTFLHCPIVIKAATAGKHILCEKPIALTIEEADKMIEAAKIAGVKFMVAHVLRFWPEYIVAKRIVEKKELGDVIQINASRFIGLPRWSYKNWLLDPTKSGGIIDIHIHDIDFIIYLLGKPDSISATGVKSDYGDFMHILTTLKYTNGKISYVEAGYLTSESYPLSTKFMIMCENGCVEGNNRMPHPITVFKKGGSPYSPRLPAKDGYLAEIEYFIDCVLHDKVVQIITPEEAKLSLKVCILAKQSAEKGGNVI